MKVKRWAHLGGAVATRDNGEWVKYDDYERRVNELIREADDLRRDCQSFDEKTKAQQVRIEKLQQALQLCRESEHQARQGIAECTMCPHLGVGDPLVDLQAREHASMAGALRRIKGEADVALGTLLKKEEGS